MADGPVRDFLLDAFGDLANVNGDFATVAGSAAVPQGISVRVKMFLGESFLDESKGIDWLGQILDIKNPNSIVVQELIREGIADTPDVTTAISASFTPPDRNREASVGYQVRDVYSTSPTFGVVGVTLP